MIICFVLLTNISFAQKPKPNCIVSPISGPTIIEGQGDVTLQYSVTSNGGHVWVLPEGCTQDVNGINDSRNIAIKFDASFSSGTIAVYRQDGGTINCESNKSYLTVIRVGCNINVNVGDDRVVYYGYNPMACANLSATVEGGTAPFTYSWSDGQSGRNISACPSTSTDYKVIVTDANGCTASDVVHVCVIDVRCYAGNSSIQKVEICHKNGKTLCISPKAVPAHLANGGSIAACGEGDDCNNASQRKASSENSDNNSISDVPSYETRELIIPTNNGNSLVIESQTFDEYVEYQIFNSIGQFVKGGYAMGNFIDVNIESLEPGIYLVKLGNQEEVHKFIK